MYDTIVPFLEQTKHWLTVGDGTYGKDAQFLQNWVCKVTASDICAHSLQIAKKRKLISDYSEENVEQLSFDDESFDLVFFKE